MVIFKSGEESQKGKFLMDFPKAVSEFEYIMQKFPVKKMIYKTAFRGRGLDFDSYRSFNSSYDDARAIDWKASLRSGGMLAKKYIEERDLSIYFLVDVSSGMLFGSSKKLKAEYAAEVVASLSHLIIGAGDKVGLIMFTEDVSKIIHPSSNKNQFFLITKFLSDSNLYGGSFDLNKGIEYSIRSVKSPYTVFILVSDFINIKKDSEKNLKRMGSRFETIAIMVRDPLDENLPKTKYQFSIKDPNSGRQMIVDPEIAARGYHHNAILQKKKFREMLKGSKIDFLELITDKSFAFPVASFLKQRSSGSRI